MDGLHHLLDADVPVIMYAGLFRTLQIGIIAVLDPLQCWLVVVEPDGTDGTSRVATLAGLRARRILTQQAAARLFVDVHLPPFLVLQLDLVVFQRLDNGQRLDMRDAGFQQPLTTVLELLLNEESHTHQCGSGLLTQILNSQSRIAVGQEVVDKQHAVLGQQVFTADNQRRVLVFGKRVHRGR